MSISKDAVFKVYRPKIPSWLDDDERQELLEEQAEYLLSEVLDYIGQGKSPVNGKSFSKLDKEYAEEEKGGNRTANMDLHGDMMRAMEYKIEDGAIKIGIWDSEQAIKAYGHITAFEGHPWLDGKVDKRKLLPDDKENFAKDILIGAEEILEDYIEYASQDSEKTSGA